TVSTEETAMLRALIFVHSRLQPKRECVVRSDTCEPVVTAVLPKAARVAIGDVHRRDPFRILETELRRDAQLERVAILRCENLVGNLERQQRLWMESRSHVDARVVSVRTLKSDIFGGEIGADALEKSAKRNPAPFSDHAPAFDADVARDLRRLRQGIKIE